MYPKQIFDKKKQFLSGVCVNLKFLRKVVLKSKTITLYHLTFFVPASHLLLGFFSLYFQGCVGFEFFFGSLSALPVLNRRSWIVFQLCYWDHRFVFAFLRVLRLKFLWRLEAWLRTPTAILPARMFCYFLIYPCQFFRGVGNRLFFWTTKLPWIGTGRFSISPLGRSHIQRAEDWHLKHESSPIWCWFFATAIDLPQIFG